MTRYVGGIEEVLLFSKTNQTVNLGVVHTYCDMPFSTEVQRNIEVVKVRVAKRRDRKISQVEF